MTFVNPEGLYTVENVTNPSEGVLRGIRLKTRKEAIALARRFNKLDKKNHYRTYKYPKRLGV